MSKRRGAADGETCGLCGEVQNPGAIKCRACGANREVGLNPRTPSGCLGWLVGLAAVVLSFRAYNWYGDLGHTARYLQIGDWLFSPISAAILVWIVFIAVFWKGRHQVVYVEPSRGRD